MPSKEFQTRIQSKTSTQAEWEANSTFVPLRGEICVFLMTDGTTNMKIGDGTTTIANLPFVVTSGGGGGSGGGIITSEEQPSGQSEGDLWYHIIGTVS